MGILKQNERKVEPFKFGELVPNEKSYADSDLFEFKSLNHAQEFKHNITEAKIRKERELEQGSAFEISDVVKEHRGLNRQAEEDFEQRVAVEVAARLEKLQQEAVQSGYDAGFAQGQDQAYQETKVIMEEKVEELSKTIESLDSQMKEILLKNKDDAYRIVKNLTKWVILKEVEEKYYLARLLEKLIHEINTKAGLVIHVNESAFGYMPEIIKIVERKLGKLTNVRVESHLDLKENGIVLESENSVIDGSLDAQFKNIDKLFVNVGLND